MSDELIDCTDTNPFHRTLYTEVGCHDAAWLVYADWLDEQSDPRGGRVRELVRGRVFARGLIPASEGAADLDAAYNRLPGVWDLLWAALCVRYCPLPDGQPLFTLLHDSRSRAMLVTTELHWCRLIDEDALQEALDRASQATIDAGNAIDARTDSGTAVYFATFAVVNAVEADVKSAVADVCNAAAHAAGHYVDAQHSQGRRAARRWCDALASILGATIWGEHRP